MSFPFDYERDHAKTYTLREWANIMKEEIDEYVKLWEGANDYHRESHTFKEWLHTVISFVMSPW